MPSQLLHRILIADRNLDLAELLKNYLGILGISNVYLHSSGCALHDLLENDFFRLAFLDAELVCEWLGRQNAFTPLQYKAGIILMHWDYTLRVQECMHRLLACAFLKKPYDALQIKDMAHLL
ncbi:hypothetical protein JW933_11995 [candidate division FCPU426 bacterium]|nr:hypothetical protein [candidate division FCPU426 bacterium]